MVKNKAGLVGYKLFFSLLAFSALVTEIATAVERGTFNPFNFFSYFTVETNLIAFVVLMLSALTVLAGRAAVLDSVRSATTVYMLVVGIGFSVLLAGLEGVKFTAVPWDNIVLHYIMPIAMLLDFIIDRPKTRLTFSGQSIWLAFPLAYVIYSLIRGPIVGWYPYPFLNPNVTSVLGMITAITGILVLSVALTWASSRVSSPKR